MNKYTAQAPTVNEAIEKALRELNIEEESAEIQVIEEGKKGFLGLGQKDAVVTVSRKQTGSVLDTVLAQASLSEQEENMSSTDPVISLRPIIEEEKEEVAEEQESTKEQMTEALLEENQQPEKHSVSETDEEAKELDPSVLDERAIQQAAEYIQEIATQMGASPVEVYIKQDGRRVTFTIETEKAGIVIGRHGKVLNALQSLVQILLHKTAHSKLTAIVDTEDYRDRREETLFRLADKTADRVIKTRRPVTLEPMPAHERKAIHHYLGNNPAVTTHSEGKEPHRYLVVSLSEERNFSDSF